MQNHHSSENEKQNYNLALFLTLTNAFLGVVAFGLDYFYPNGRLAIAFWGISFLAGGYFGTIEAVKALLEKKLNIDFLMIAAALGSAAIGRPAEGAILLFLFSLSNTLQSFALSKSRKSIAGLIKLRPQTVRIKSKEGGKEISIQEAKLGDIFLVKPGEAIPLDGLVVEGISEVNQANLTGESLPLPKKPGEIVLAGTFNTYGFLEVKVTKLSHDTTLAKVIDLVEEAWNNKAKTQQWLDVFEVYYALGVVLISLMVIAVPYFWGGKDFYLSFYQAMIFLVVASPCALIISTPASIISAIANGARNGILFKGGYSLELAANIQVLALDKTGTITQGTPSVVQVVTFQGTEKEMFQNILGMEEKSEHLIAKAIVRHARSFEQEKKLVENFQALHGMGVFAEVENKKFLVGNKKLFHHFGIFLPDFVEKKAQEILLQAQTLIYVFSCPASQLPSAANEKSMVFSGGDFLGIIALADPLKPDVQEMLKKLKEYGIKKTVLLTGDNEQVAAQVCKKVGIDEFYADLLPQNKSEQIKKLRARYKTVAMFGDGVNDAPALALADFGIAAGEAGTDVAIESADAVLMTGNLKKMIHLFGLAKKTRRIIFQNLTFSVLVIVFLVLYNFQFHLALPYGVVAHEGSTVLVILNGMRLLFFQPPSP